MSWLKNIFSKQPTREPQTHDYGPDRRYWGHDYYFTPTGDGKHGRLYGWGHGLLEGDYILLDDKHGGTTRYKLENVRYESNPSDMWFADAIFAPRQMTRVEREEELEKGGGNSSVEKSEFIA